jgi:hypothetical protein
MLKGPEKDRQRGELSKIDKNGPIYSNIVYIGSACQSRFSKISVVKSYENKRLQRFAQKATLNASLVISAPMIKKFD